MSDSYHDQHELFIDSLFNTPGSSGLQELALCTMEVGQTPPTSIYGTTGIMQSITKTNA